MLMLLGNYEGAAGLERVLCASYFLKDGTVLRILDYTSGEYIHSTMLQVRWMHMKDMVVVTWYDMLYEG